MVEEESGPGISASRILLRAGVLAGTLALVAGCVVESGETTAQKVADLPSESESANERSTIPMVEEVQDEPRASMDLPEGTDQALVVTVLDGDTLDVQLSDGRIERVRLIGTNAPEGSECFGQDATQGLTGLIADRPVRLETDTSDRDRYGRLLRYVWTTDGTLVNEWTVAEGYAIARDYPPDTARSSALHEAADRARESGAGLWASAACGPADPAHLVIAHIEHDAPGDDNQNLNGEWVDIQSLDDNAIDLTGWVLKDESASHRFRFPAGTTLDPGELVRVFTGCGSDSPGRLYWCNTGSAVWNNSGDTAFLLDPAGNIVFTSAYDG